MEITCAAILFDMDGVLVDSLAIVKRHWTRWAETHNVSQEELVRVAFGRTSVEAVAMLAPHLDAEEEGRRLEEAEGHDTEGLVIYPAAGPLLWSLPAGKWAIATSADRQTAITRLRFGELPIPSVFVTARDVTQGKPHPEPYLKAAAGLGVAAADCVVVEDTPMGIAAGKAAGATVIAVASTHDPAILSQADAIVDDLGALRVSAGPDGRLTVAL